MLYVSDVRLPDSQVNTVPRSDGRQSDQMYLGVYNTLEKAVAAYDRAALKFYGKGAALNVRHPFCYTCSHPRTAHRSMLSSVARGVQKPLETYTADAEDEEQRARMNVTQYVNYLKATSDAQRGKSSFRGVSQRESGRWQARMSGVSVRTPPPPFSPLLCCHITL